MYQGSPFETPSPLRGRVDREIARALAKRPSQMPPASSSEGWRRWAAIGFATAPGVVFLVVVLIHVIVRP